MRTDLLMTSPWIAGQHFEYCIQELLVAKQKLTLDAIESQEPQKIKAALSLLFASNRRLIAGLDEAYKTLQTARSNNLLV